MLLRTRHIYSPAVVQTSLKLKLKTHISKRCDDGDRTKVCATDSIAKVNIHHRQGLVV